jgi:sialate O-acetylesterase
MKKKITFFLITALLLNNCSYRHKLTAKHIWLSPLYSSGMVIQSDPSTVIKGSADPGSTLAVRIKDYVLTTRADQQGKWEVLFPEIKYEKPFSISIEGIDTIIKFNNVQAGRCYLVAGNAMLDPLDALKPGRCKKQEKTEKILIRVFQPEINNLEVITGRWYPLDELPEKEFVRRVVDLVCQNLDKDIQNVGVLNMTVPGANLDSWLSPGSPLISMVTQASGRKYLLENKQLLDSVRYLKDSCRTGLADRVTGIWYNDAGWNSTNLPVNIARKNINPAKRIVYLRKKINIAPPYVNSGFRINLGYVHGSAEFFLNGQQVMPAENSGKIILQIPDSFVTSSTNLLCVRLFMKDTLSGFYGSDMACYNHDSGYYKPVQEDWKYNFMLESDFPEFTLNGSSPSLLYKNLLDPLKDYPAEDFFWYDDNLDSSPDQELKLAEILNYFQPSGRKIMVVTLPEENDPFPDRNLQTGREELLKAAAEKSGAEILYLPSDSE